MTIENLMFSEGPSIYYDDGFRRVIEDHMTVLRESPETREVDVTPGVAYKYAGDFYGLAQSLGVPPHLHWVTMRLNGLFSPNDYLDTMYVVRIPSPTALEQLRQSHMSTRKVT